MTTLGDRTAVAGGGRLPSFPTIVRGDDAVVAGVCSGIARASGVDPTVVRLVFTILAFAGGSGIVLYLAAWLFLPAPSSGAGRAAGAKALAAVLFAASVFLALRGLGLGDSLLIPAALIATGVVIVARRAGRPRSSVHLLLGAAFVLTGTAYYVNQAEPFGDDAAPVAPGAVAIALVAILAPSLWRLAREREAERLERTRVQERAEMAARVHDSVLQTLALIQRHAGDPRQVATLARAQERELRGWLYAPPPAAGETVAAAVERHAAEIEALHGVRIDVVSAGDAPLDERLEALVLAAREAMANAAKFSGAAAVSVYAEADDARAAVFVRDRGVGFDPATLPRDRHGIRDSIEARLQRHGGAALVTSIPGAGTEVELTMPRRRP